MKNNLLKRAEILCKIRDFFYSRGFVEIDSPLVVARPNMEPNLEVMETKVKKNNGEELPAFLITSPEFALKKLLATGLTKIYQMGKCFRNNEPWNESHNPEFTLLEWYETGVNYFDLMNRTEELIMSLLGGGNELIYQGKKIKFTSPWLKISMREAWQKYGGADLNEYLTYDTMRALAAQKNYTVTKNDSWEDLFFKIFLSEIEPRLMAENQPVFLFDYPIQMAALSRVKKEDPRYAERFELYIGGLEIANAYGELIDAEEQKKRFEEDQKEQVKRGLARREIDEDFLAALRSGLPASAGIALGVDRVIMLLTDSQDIAEVTPFTTKEIY